MNLKKILKYTGCVIAFITGIILLFVLASLIKVDRTHYRKLPFYADMQQNLDSLKRLDIPEASQVLRVGYAKTNITPSYRTSTAGYAKRKGALFPYVHDSIYVRTMVMNNGTKKIAIVTADLLIIPPIVTQLLAKKLPEIGFNLNNTYLSATHTHNSVGNWSDHLVGEIYAGSYDGALVEFIANKIVESIQKAAEEQIASRLYVASVPVGGAVNNRLADEEGTVDSLLRVIEVRRNDSSRLVLTSFTAHATCLYGRDLELSRDYPGRLVDELEDNGYAFAMFLAGAVGSHGCMGPEDGWDRIDYLGTHIAHTFLDRRESLEAIDDSTIVMFTTPLELGEPQLRISKDWRVRPWLFYTFLGDYRASLTVLRIGDVVMLGTPCDFSGELMPPIDSTAKQHGLKAMVTSFNGGYIGYITLDRHYDRNHYETRLMNWFGPGNGAYLSGSMIELIEAVSKE